MEIRTAALAPPGQRTLNNFRKRLIPRRIYHGRHPDYVVGSVLSHITFGHHDTAYRGIVSSFDHDC